MKTVDEHRKILRQITDTAFSTGLNSLTEQQKKRLPNLSKEEIEIFIQKCHDGYKSAQKMLIKEILEYQDLLAQVKVNLKDVRRRRDKSDEVKITESIHVIEHRIKTFTHVADGIAWAMIGGEIHIARRFHIGEWEVKQLKSSNMEHAMQVTDAINTNPNYFALLSDLTGFMQIGDLLVKTKIGNIVIELKEGKVNHEISEFLDRLEANKEDLDESKLSETFDKYAIKQIKRMVRQRKRMERADEVIKNDKGINPADGKNIRVYTPKIPTEKYFEELIELHQQLNQKKWSYGVVDGCLLIGMYKEDMVTKGGPYFVELILKEKAKNYIVIDWQSITNALSEPIFSKPLTPDFVIDVLTGKVKVIMGLEFDKLVDLFNHEGLKTRWMTAIDTKRLKTRNNDTFTVNGRAIEITTPDGEATQIGGGIISKILYDSIRPSNIARQFLHLNTEDFEEDGTVDQ